VFFLLVSSSGRALIIRKKNELIGYHEDEINNSVMRKNDESFSTVKFDIKYIIHRKHQSQKC
jgi:hypothetical protein